MFCFCKGGPEVCSEMRRKQICLKKPAGPFIKGAISFKIDLFLTLHHVTKIFPNQKHSKTVALDEMSR